MSRQIKPGSVADRILRLLGERYPITEDEVCLALGLRKDVVHLELLRLRASGLVTLETVGSRTFVALTGLRGPATGRTPPPPDDPAFT